jgi:hypothetical protein
MASVLLGALIMAGGCLCAVVRVVRNSPPGEDSFGGITSSDRRGTLAAARGFLADGSR